MNLIAVGLYSEILFRFELKSHSFTLVRYFFDMFCFYGFCIANFCFLCASFHNLSWAIIFLVSFIFFDVDDFGTDFSNVGLFSLHDSKQNFWIRCRIVLHNAVFFILLVYVSRALFPIILLFKHMHAHILYKHDPTIVPIAHLNGRVLFFPCSL